MRFQFFVFSVLYLCYIISALSEQNFEQNRPKRTIILKTMIKKMLWQKFSNYMNLPITRRPSINLTTLRNRIPRPTKQSTQSKSVVPPMSPSGPNSITDRDPSRDNRNNNMASVSIRNSVGRSAAQMGGTSGPVGNNNNQQISMSAGQINNEPNNPSSPASMNDPNSVGLEFSSPDGFTDRRTGPRKQLSNDFRATQFANQNYRQAYAPEEQNFRLPSGPSGEQNYGSNSRDFSFSAPIRSIVPHNSPTSNQQSNSPRSRPPVEQNNQPTSTGFSFSAPESNSDRNNSPSPSKQQSSPLSDPSPVQNDRQTSDSAEQGYVSTPGNIPATGTSDQRNEPQQLQQQQRQQQSNQSPIFNDEQFNDYSFNRNKPLDFSSYSNQENSNQNLDNQFQAPKSSYDSSRFSNENLNNENFVQQRNQISQSNSSPTPFLINYPHHQHYQQLIPSTSNKLYNSIQNVEIPQNNYHHQQIYNHQGDSSNLNQYHQPALNLYSPEQYYY